MKLTTFLVVALLTQFSAMAQEFKRFARNIRMLKTFDVMFIREAVTYIDRA